MNSLPSQKSIPQTNYVPSLVPENMESTLLWAYLVIIIIDKRFSFLSIDYNKAFNIQIYHINIQTYSCNFKIIIIQLSYV